MHVGPAAGSDSEGEGKTQVSGPSREEVYGAYHKGTLASKKKKQKKLKRVMASGGCSRGCRGGSDSRPLAGGRG